MEQENNIRNIYAMKGSQVLNHIKSRRFAIFVRCLPMQLKNDHGSKKIEWLLFFKYHGFLAL